MPTVGDHFYRRAPSVRAIYDRIVAAASALGPVIERPNTGSIHLARKTVFAGVTTRKDWLILTLKMEAEIRSRRFHKREQASAHRWHLEMHLTDAAQVDRELKTWLKAAYELSG